MENNKYKMEITLNVLNHLGINLYSNVPAVLSEVVANAWDADAEEVEISIDKGAEEIIIQDDGSGMDLNDINDKYLTVGYRKRYNGELLTPIHNRPVMGRKGIGKLSLFSIADVIEVYSKKGEDKNAFSMSTSDIREQIKLDQSKPYCPKELSTTSIDFEKDGTRIVLKGLKKRLIHTETALRKRLSRRFSVIGDKYKFKILLEDEEVKIEDRDYFHKIEYLWSFGKDSKFYEQLAINVKETEQRDNLLNGGHRVTGWLGLVENSQKLQEGDDNLNKIVLMVRGKMAKEDMLEEFREGGLYAKYLFGEISADFLDSDDKPDIATSSRQSIVEEDERYIALKEFLWEELKNIQRKREEYKSKSAVADALTIEPIKEWYKTLGSDRKNRAKKLFAKINQVAVDEKHKKQLFAHGVLAFESLRYKESLDALDKISTENIDEFLNIFKEFDEIEATLYYKITKERLQIIQKLKEKVHDEDALERILQEHLFKYLWLLDPSWDRATETAYMEERATTEFRKIDAKLTEDERKGRIDIKYKKPSGKHVIIELKRASVKTTANKLQEQVDKYMRALRKLIRASSEETSPIIEAVCVVGKPLDGWEDSYNEEQDRRAMEVKNTRVVTYQQLINDAYNSYKEYLDKNQDKGRIIDLINKIESDS